MQAKEFSKLLKKYAAGQCSKEEEELILRWYNQINVNDDTNVPEIEAALWQKIKPKKSQGSSQRLLVRKIAAVFLSLVLAGGGILLYKSAWQKQRITKIRRIVSDEVIHIKNDNTFPLLVKLSDSSEVTLQPQSEIDYPNTFRDHKREVFLSGEAFFSVEKDSLRPFYVYSKEITTKVLGTSFNIKAYEADKEVTVAVRTGKVSVSTHTSNVSWLNHRSEEMILTPNQQAVYNRSMDKVSRELVDKPMIVLQKPTLFEMEYDGASVAKIFSVLEDNYGVDIQYDEYVLSSCILTTSMAEEGLYERIEIICKAIGASYKVEDAVIIIESNGC